MEGAKLSSKDATEGGSTSRTFREVQLQEAHQVSVPHTPSLVTSPLWGTDRSM